MAPEPRLVTSLDDASSAELKGSLLLSGVASGWQSGSMAGVGIVAPIVHLWKGRPATPSHVLAATAYAALAVTGVYAASQAANVSDLSRQGLERCVAKLQRDEGQTREHLFTGVGAVAGAAMAVCLAQPALHLVALAARGSVLGIVAHVATSAPATWRQQQLQQQQVGSASPVPAPAVKQWRFRTI